MSATTELREMTEAMSRAAKAAAPSLRRMGEAMQQVAEAADKMMDTIYEAAGKPFGDNRAGRNRYIFLLGEMVRFRDELIEARAGDRAFAQMREILKPYRAA